MNQKENKIHNKIYQPVNRVKEIIYRDSTYEEEKNLTKWERLSYKNDSKEEQTILNYSLLKIVAETLFEQKMN